MQAVKSFITMKPKPKSLAKIVFVRTLTKYYYTINCAFGPLVQFLLQKQNYHRSPSITLHTDEIDKIDWNLININFITDF